MYSHGPPQGGGGRFAQAQVAHFAFFYEAAHGSHSFFDGCAGVHAVLVVQVDVVSAEATKTGFTGRFHVLGPAVDAALAGVGGVAHDAELGGNHHPVTLAFESFGQQLFVFEGTVHVGRIKERDAQLHGPVQGADAFGIVLLTVKIGHAHAAEAESRNSEARAAEGAGLHKTSGKGGPGWLTGGALRGLPARGL